MKAKVTFREYGPPFVDDETGESERGDYYGSFCEEIEGNNLREIVDTASKKAEDYSKQRGTEVRVWEIPFSVSPRGILVRKIRKPFCD